jgi:hypothetical protein
VFEKRAKSTTGIFKKRETVVQSNNNLRHFGAIQHGRRQKIGLIRSDLVGFSRIHSEWV